jgi:hypothetical protein
MGESLKDFLFNLIVSIFLGLFVGMAEVTAININSETVTILIICSILGGIIGTISRLVFIYIFDIKQKGTKLAFIAVFIVIGVISCTPSAYYYLAEGVNSSVISIAPILVTAEFLGMSFCYYSYKRGLDLNLKLINKKKQLTKK